MVPFLSEEIASILKWAMWFFVNKQDNLMLKTDIKLTTSAKEVLKKVPTNLHQGLKDSWVIF